MRTIIATLILTAAISTGCSRDDIDRRSPATDSIATRPGDTARTADTVTPEPPDTASVTGTIVRIEPPESGDTIRLGTLVLADPNNPDTTGNRTIAWVMRATRIHSDTKLMMTFTDLKTGMLVRAIYRGAVPAIYPMRMSAEEIVVISAGG